MAIEPDVVELLMQYDFLDLASRIIHDTTIPRLMVSLFWNMINMVLVYVSCYTVGLGSSMYLLSTISSGSVAGIHWTYFL